MKSLTKKKTSFKVIVCLILPYHAEAFLNLVALPLDEIMIQY